MLRLSVIIWIFTAYLIQVFFSCNLETSFSIHSLPKQLDSLADLLDANYKIYLSRGGSTLQFYRDSKKPEDQRFIKKALADGTLLNRDTFYTLSMIKRLLTEDAGCMGVDRSFYPILDEFYATGSCQKPPFRFIKDLPGNLLPSVIILNRNTLSKDLRHRISIQALTVREIGLTDYFAQLMYGNAERCLLPPEEEEVVEIAGVHALPLSFLYGTFLILPVACSLCLMILLFELVRLWDKCLLALCGRQLNAVLPSSPKSGGRMSISV